MLKNTLLIFTLCFTSLFTFVGSFALAQTQPSAFSMTGMGFAQSLGFYIFMLLTALIIFVFWKIATSTRQPVDQINTKEAYKVRKLFFIVSLIIVLGALVVTLPKTPYPDALKTPDHLVYVTSIQFGFIFSHEPITSAADLGKVSPISSLDLPTDSLIEFRVTSIDVNHGFAIYGPDRVIKAQTQAMPGYVNRLRVRFDEPGEYNVLCLEYCGTAHHFMRVSFNIQ